MSETLHRLKEELAERTGDLAGAIQELDLSVEKDPSDAVAHFYYAIALFEARRFNDALTHGQSNSLAAKKAIASDSNDETAVSALAGLAFHRTAPEQLSWTNYIQKHQRINPDNFWVHVGQGYWFMQQKQNDKAVAEFSAAEKDDFPDPVAYLALESI
jgi:tetratricopeptide (TPR) repeat protein